MLKRFLCMAIIAVVAIVPLTIVSVGAKTFNMGDTDLSGNITVKDSTLIRKCIASAASLSEFQMELSDVDGNKRLNIKDATLIQKYLAGIVNEGVFDKTIDDESIEGGNPPGTTSPVKEPDTEEIVTTESTLAAITEPTSVPVTSTVPEDDEDEADLSTIDGIEKAVAEKFLEYVNEERIAVGVMPLKMNSTLTKAAKVRSNEIILCWSHDRPDGTSCFTAIENMWSFGQVGENLAYNGGICSFSEESIQADIEYAARVFFGQFKSSPGHYANMIRENFICTGIGVEIQGASCYMAHMFGSIDA